MLAHELARFQGIKVTCNRDSLKCEDMDVKEVLTVKHRGAYHLRPKEKEREEFEIWTDDQQTKSGRLEPGNTESSRVTFVSRRMFSR